MLNRFLRVSISLALVCSLVLLSSCSGKKNSGSTSVIKIGTEDITGNFNPFYAESRGDTEIMKQIYPSIQRKGPDNTLINDLGSITYEYEEGDRVKYTVTIRDDLSFSDGTKVNIDDVIFWYYFLADATYDGVYSDFYLNDIEGLKEYYFDDENYASVISNLAGSESHIASYIKKNYANGTDVSEISGIKRVDDYTCTVLFNSRNINAVSQINATIVPKAFYGANYVKGEAAKVKEITGETLGCGPYYLSGYSEKDHTASMVANDYAVNKPSVFTRAEFKDLKALGKDAAKALANGDVNIVSAPATGETVSSFGSSVKTVLGNNKAYTSLFISSSVPQEARKTLMGLFSLYDMVENEYSGYYTGLVRPLSVRFEEYPAGLEPYYKSTLKGAFLSSMVTSLNAICAGTEDDLDYKLLRKFSEDVAQYNVNIKVKACSQSEFDAAVKNGSADIWIASTPDGDTCDKYDYYNTLGSKNFTRLSDPEIDELTLNIRRATGFADRGALTGELLEKVMESATELPLYQLQTVIAYDTGVIDEKSLIDVSEYDGYADILPRLY